MPYNLHKRNLIREAQENRNTITIFYEKKDSTRVRRVIEPYEVREEKTKDGVKNFLYGVDVTFISIQPPDRRIKKFNVEGIGLIIVNRNKSFSPSYPLRIV